jgi:hypothetical protein
VNGYPSDVRTFYSPVDDVHGVLVALLASTQKSIVLNMYGYDDDELNEIILAKLADEQINVQMSLDRSQAGGVHEKIDDSVVIAAETRAELDRNHDAMLEQMAAERGGTSRT